MTEIYYTGNLTGKITKLSELENDTGFIKEESDPIYQSEKETTKIIDGGEMT